MGAQMVHSNNKQLPWLQQKEPGGQGEEKPALHFLGQWLHESVPGQTGRPSVDPLEQGLDKRKVGPSIGTHNGSPFRPLTQVFVCIELYWTFLSVAMASANECGTDTFHQRCYIVCSHLIMQVATQLILWDLPGKCFPTSIRKPHPSLFLHHH